MHPYFRLLRLHQPTGIWLLLLPCGWGLALASEGMPPLPLLVLFALGAVVMRGAGCIVNDLWDRKFDRQVERTKTRPLASGEISVVQALALLSVLLLAALLIALMLPRIVLALAALSLILVALYPLMKRVTWWPQAFLGLTFNWGALMGYAAVRGALEPPALLLYGAGFFWTLAYDTIYAHQDKADDARISVKSTALLLGENKASIAVFFTLMFLCLAAAGYAAQLSPAFYVALTLATAHPVWQVRTVRLSEPASCLRIFKANTILCLIIFGCLLLNAF